MRLISPRVTLIPVPHPVAAAVAAHTDAGPALESAGLTAGPGWPHDDSADALRPHAEHGAGEALGTFLITTDEPQPGSVIGECGWFGLPDANGETEIGYGLTRSARGHGLGAEAVAALVTWVEQQPGVRRVSAHALVGNEASRRLLVRLGFTEDGGTPPYVRYVRPYLL